MGRLTAQGRSAPSLPARWWSWILVGLGLLSLFSCAALPASREGGAPPQTASPVLPELTASAPAAITSPQSTGEVRVGAASLTPMTAMEPTDTASPAPRATAVASAVDIAPAGAETPVNATSPALTGTDVLRAISAGPTYALWGVGAIPACGPVAEAFGLQMLVADDTIDRAGLEASVSLDAAALRRLEAAVHPATITDVGQAIVAALQPVVAEEAIQLIKRGMHHAYDALGAVSAVPVYDYRIVNVYPHDPDAFTQGLVFHDGILYEGTGLRGASTLRKVDLESGEILQLYSLPPDYFGEGITVYGERVIQLTWQEETGFVYDRDSFDLLETFTYTTEGWGITHDGTRLIMSDGTANLYFWDPETFEEIGRVQVYDDNGPVVRLNELEYIQGQVYANVWLTDLVAIIDPQSGQVIAYIDLSGLLAPEDRDRQVDVLNGIAYDAEGDRLFVTGKWWPQLFEIELIPPPGRVLLPLAGR